MSKINQDTTRVLTGTAQSFGDLVLRYRVLFSGGSFVRPRSLLGVQAASGMAPCKTNTQHYFRFLPFFFHKSQILFRFLLVKTGTNVGLTNKHSGCKANFQNQGISIFPLDLFSLVIPSIISPALKKWLTNRVNSWACDLCSLYRAPRLERTHTWLNALL